VKFSGEALISEVSSADTENTCGSSTNEKLLWFANDGNHYGLGAVVSIDRS
jgi:hypothetical protein